METQWSQFGFRRVAAIVPQIQLGDPSKNAQILVHALKKASSDEKAAIVVTPELALTGYTCEDLFHSDDLIQKTEKALLEIKEASSSHSLWVVGAPLRLGDGRMFNVAFVFHSKKIIGAVPKQYLPNMGEFYERRWFIGGAHVHENVNHATLGSFCLSQNQIFEFDSIKLGIEICHDLWAPESPSVALALRGANVIANLSASNEVLGKDLYRKKLVEVQSHKLQCGYLYVSAGTYESSKDTVFSGHCMAAELGEVVNEILPFSVQDEFRNEKMLIVDLDLERIVHSRTKDVCFLENVQEFSKQASSFGGNALKLHQISGQSLALENLVRKLSPYPFLAEVGDFEKVLNIQSQGLLRRAESSQAKSLIVGISGGLDSTLALLVATRARAFSGNKLKVIGVTLPGPGTSEKTLNLARTLLNESGVDQIIEVPISEAVTQHMKDLGKQGDQKSVVFENAQARERTQILFNLANEHFGLVVGTGDLSELALGWCTFNADHMAHYAVNAGVPKTVVKGLVGYWADIAHTRNLKAALVKILELPISPELLPPDEKGEITQETEETIGSYALHDFFIYHLLNFGFSKEKINALAHEAFKDEKDFSAEEIDHACKILFGRFFKQQFKRTTLPPGPKVHSVSLSPRSDFRLPDEI